VCWISNSSLVVLMLKQLHSFLYVYNCGCMNQLQTVKFLSVNGIYSSSFDFQLCHK
jgi:hypothetical protein